MQTMQTHPYWIRSTSLASCRYSTSYRDYTGTAQTGLTVLLTVDLCRPHRFGGAGVLGQYLLYRGREQPGRGILRLLE